MEKSASTQSDSSGFADIETGGEVIPVSDTTKVRVLSLGCLITDRNQR